jgi:hypothetical protein
LKIDLAADEIARQRLQPIEAAPAHRADDAGEFYERSRR